MSLGNDIVMFDIVIFTLVGTTRGQENVKIDVAFCDIFSFLSFLSDG